MTFCLFAFLGDIYSSSSVNSKYAGRYLSMVDGFNTEPKMIVFYKLLVITTYISDLQDREVTVLVALVDARQLH